ncbi:sulfate ABC transporter substrate-binding protein [Mycolicibacterium komossense]|uniref:Sulfate ABC transporter substrate-binding protein n=1 Tax=Mycolicibacterium komossense TaxID=1779 RepID=A0ABT3C8C7_9MYCO|nr:sulfate ABC transporter substrate-binding protein [Mycolicibacterium komossense]MCV7225709.1 sulfate ABC transporter substrate-binding protein [Mycolicibacterium komossense]
MSITHRRRVLHWTSILLILLVAATGVSACGKAGGVDTEQGKTPNNGLALSAFTSAQAGWNAVVPAFLASPQGAGITIDNPDYGASGDLAQAIIDGHSADLVNFSDEPSVNRLVRAGRVASDWNAGPAKGSPYGSVMTLMVRAGNPKNIHDWSDLLQPGLEVVTPNPVLSGSGKWGLLAGYAAISNGGQDPAAGQEFLRALVLEHVKIAPSTARQATDAFLQGEGDVLITAESGAIDAERHSQAVIHVTPPQTMAADNLVAIIKDGPHVDAATRLNDYLYTPDAQRLWARAGFRPSDPTVAAEFADEFPMPQKLWTIDDLGGWNATDARFFDSQNGTITKIFKEAVQ